MVGCFAFKKWRIWPVNSLYLCSYSEDGRVFQNTQDYIGRYTAILRVVSLNSTSDHSCFPRLVHRRYVRIFPTLPRRWVKTLSKYKLMELEQGILVPRVGAQAGPDFLSMRRNTRFVFSTNQLCQICQIWREVRDLRTSSVGRGQSSRSLPQARRIVGSWDENGIGLILNHE